MGVSKDIKRGMQASDQGSFVRTWLDGIVQNLIDRLDFLVGRGVQNDDDGTDQANGTAQLAQRAKLLIQEVRSQHGADQDTESSQRSHQDSRGKGVGGEVAYFSDSNCRGVRR